MNNSGMRKLISFSLAVILTFGMTLPVSADGAFVLSGQEILGGASAGAVAGSDQSAVTGEITETTQEPDGNDGSDDADDTGIVSGGEEGGAEVPDEPSGDGSEAAAPEDGSDTQIPSESPIVDGGTEEAEDPEDPADNESAAEQVTEDDTASFGNLVIPENGNSIFDPGAGPLSGNETSDILLETQSSDTATISGVTQSEAPIKDGVYIFRSVLNNDYVLDVKNGGIFNGSKIQLRQYDKSDSEMFRFKRNSDGTYTITAYNCEKALEVAGGSTENGARLQLYTSNNHAGQRWRVYRNADKTYTIKNAFTKKAIDISGGIAEEGRAVQMWKSNNTDAQKFRLRMLTRPKHKYIGQYMVMTAKTSRKVIDIAAGSKAMSANAQLYKANGSLAQWFQLAYVGEGFYRIINMNSRKTLDVAGGAMNNGTNVRQYSFNGSAAQLWRISDNGDGTVSFHSKKKDSMVLEIAGGKTANGTNIQIHSSDGSKGQKFILDKTGKMSMGTQAKEYKDLSESAVVKKIGPLCKADQKKSGVLACVTIAQFILESGYGSTDLAQNANNCFGMKTSLSGNTWEGSVWDGVSKYTKKTAEYDSAGKKYYITADFRKYPCVEDSIADHSAYLTHAKNGSKLRYAGLKGEKDYKKAITIIKKGGYATDPQYVNKICNIIERFDLTKYNA